MTEGNQDPNAGAGAAGQGGTGNPDPNQGGAGAGEGAGAGAAGGEAKWYSTLEGELATHPAIQKFESPTALAKGYIEAEKFVSYDKVVKPKGPEDSQGWQKHNSAMGVPGDATGYNEVLMDPKEVPQGMTFDKGKFATAIHQMGLRPDQAAKAYGMYTTEFIEGHKATEEAYQTSLNASETELRREWGSAYDQNLEMGTRFVRHQIKDDAEFNRINAIYSADPGVMKLFAQAGREFSENSIGGFKDSGGSKMTPAQAQEEYDNIVGNPKDDYYNDTNSVRQRRIKYVESLVEQGADPAKMG